MNTLQELARVSRPQLTPGSHQERYYTLLKKGKSKQEIIDLLFADTVDPSNSLSQISRTLKKKMIAWVASQTSKTSNAALNEHTECYQLFAAGKYLTMREAQKAGIEILEECFKLAIKNEIVGTALDCAELLASHYGGLSYNRRKLSYYMEKCRELSQKRSAESMARFYYNEISAEYSHQWSPKIADKAYTYCNETASTITASPRTAWLHYSTLCFAHISAMDFNSLVSTCDEANDHFSQFDNRPKYSYYTFLVNKTVGLVKLNKYNEALDCTEAIIKLTPIGSYTYCAALYYQVIIGIHSNNINLSDSALNNVEPYLKSLPPNFQEQWDIMKAYVGLFFERKFRVGKFLNEVPIFEKDKAGANVAILIVQMLHYLKMGKTDKYIERCDAISRYSYRHIPEHQRTVVKLLVEVYNGRFNSIVVKERTKKLVKDLQKPSRDLEIMPVGMIWELVLGWLG